jgi:aspartate--ammonia ligase
MGIRVNKQSLDDQLNQSDMAYKKDLPFHSLIYKDELPLCIGGGIGQSRLCMLLLQKAHVGEVQVSIWPEEVVKECEKAGIILL